MRALRRFAVLLAVTWLLLELAAYALYPLVYRERFSFTRIAERRQRRIDTPAAPLSPGAPGFNGTVPHPFLGFVYDPAINSKESLAFHGVPVSGWGFLDDKPPLQPKDPSRTVIGIFGGSVSFWLSVRGVDALLAELAKVPELRGRKLVVVRTALGGFKQPQQLMTLQYLLALGGHFDLVINLDGLNEIALPQLTELSRGVFPPFPRGWPEMMGVASGPEQLRRVGRVAELEAAAKARAERFSAWVPRHSILLSTLWSALDRSAEAALMQARLAAETAPPAPGSRLPFAATGPHQDYADPVAALRYLVAVWSNSSLQMSRVCAANGIRYVHFLQPNQYVPDSKPMTAAEQRVAVEPASGWAQSVRAGYPLLQQAGQDLARAGVEFHDLTGVFAQVREPLYMDTCCHLNQDGNIRLARRMGELVRSRWESSQP